MRFVKVVTLTALALLAHTNGLDAQSRAQLKVGARVRLGLPGEKPIKGMVTRIDPDSIGFLENAKNSESIMISKSDLRSVEIGQRSTIKGILQKGLIGTGLGVAGGALLGAATYGGECDLFVCSRAQNAVFASMVVGIVGGVSGLFVGAITGSDRWTKVSVPR